MSHQLIRKVIMSAAGGEYDARGRRSMDQRARLLSLAALLAHPESEGSLVQRRERWVDAVTGSR
jgi:hypothetical protein